jgi:hypothetical protein
MDRYLLLGNCSCIDLYGWRKCRKIAWSNLAATTSLWIM